jgi:hypothetical protein
LAGFLAAGCEPVEPAAGNTALPATSVAEPDQVEAVDTFSVADQAPYVLGESLAAAKPPREAEAKEAFPLKDWDDLVPRDWDPMRAIGELDFSQLSDSDPRAMNALRKLQDAWKDAPVNPRLNNTRMRIAGFVVPLDNAKGRIKEFLLVPYFGACIHVPPPPSNQIIHVVLPKGSSTLEAMVPVWVSGTLAVNRNETAMGWVSYGMLADVVETFAEPPRDRLR